MQIIRYQEPLGLLPCLCCAWSTHRAVIDQFMPTGTKATFRGRERLYMTMLVLHQWHFSNDRVKIQKLREIYKSLLLLITKFFIFHESNAYKLQNACKNGGKCEFKCHWVMIILTSLKVHIVKWFQTISCVVNVCSIINGSVYKRKSSTICGINSKWMKFNCYYLSSTTI